MTSLKLAAATHVCDLGTPVKPAFLGRLESHLGVVHGQNPSTREADHPEFKANLGYIFSSKLII